MVRSTQALMGVVEANLLMSAKAPRLMPEYKVSIQKVDLRAFGDADKDGFCAAVYSLVQHNLVALFWVSFAQSLDCPSKT